MASSHGRSASPADLKKRTHAKEDWESLLEISHLFPLTGEIMDALGGPPGRERNPRMLNKGGIT